MPSTSDSASPPGPDFSSGIQAPDPRKEPASGSAPEPSICAAGMSLDSLATYSVPSSRIVMLAAIAAGSRPG